MGLQEQGWFMDRVREFFGFLDKLVYGLIKWILFGIFDLANLSTNSEVFSGIYSRIYVILGIFMAFKLSFAFFQYIIDPESMTGKSDKSLSKLLIRTFVMISALVFLPTILFGQNGGQGLLSRAQTAFLPSLPKVIFGVNSVGGLSAGDNSNQKFTDSVEQSANDIAINTLRGFFAPSPDIDSVCGDGTYENTPQIETLDDFSNNINLHCNKGINIDAGILGHTAAVYYKYSYMPFISTVVGVLVALLLLGITLDLAKRIFKLMILEVIAPVPIMSLIDPKGSKDGAFSKWVKSLTSTFLDIFFKLGLVYIIVVFIHLIVNSRESGGLFANFPKDTGFRGTYLTILLIIGLIFFAKEAPKFIKDAMGLKDNGGGLFDDVKSVGKVAGLTVGAAGVVGSGIASGRASYDSDTATGKNHNVGRLAKNVGAGLIGGISGGATAIKAATGKDGGIGAVIKAQSQRNANVLARGASGSTWLGRRESELSGIFTGQTPANRYERELDDLKARKEYFDAIKNRVTSKMPERVDTFGSFGNGVLAGHKFNYNSVMAAVESAQAAGRDVVDLTDSTGTTHSGISIADIARGRQGLLDNNEADYYEQVMAGGFIDPATGIRGDTDSTLEELIGRHKDVGIDSPYQYYGKVPTGAPPGSKALKPDMGATGREIYATGRRVKTAKANDRYSAAKK